MELLLMEKVLFSHNLTTFFYHHASCVVIDGCPVDSVDAGRLQLGCFDRANADARLFIVLLLRLFHLGDK